MDQNEIQETENKEPEEEITPEQPQKKGMNAYTAIVLIGAAVIIFVFMMMNGGSPAKSENDGCGVNFQSAWGQTPAAVWVDLGSYNETKAVATFDFTYPEKPLEGYDSENFRGYSRQIFEVAFTDDAGREGIRFSKAYTCNGFEVYEPKDAGEYRSIQIMDVGGIDVKEYGDGETVSMLFFVKGDYSYTILLTENPMSREEAEVFVPMLD